MAIYAMTIGDLAASFYVNTDINATKAGIVSASNVVYSVDVDNRLNSAASYLKLWNVAVGSVTVGTTVPDWIIEVPAAGTASVYIPEGITFGTALTVACVTEDGTGGTTNPTSDVTIEISYT